MSDKKPTSDYAGRRMTLGEFMAARGAIEAWANREHYFSDPKLYEDICHLCTLAQGMWFNTRTDRAGR